MQQGLERNGFERPRRLRLEVQREALLAHLSTSAAPITALIAPAGYGKTTLAAQFAAVHRRVLWINAEEDDAKPWVWARRVAAGIARLEGLQEETTENAPEEPTSPGLAARLNALEFNALLVFDGLERLSPPSAQMLEQLLEQLEEGHRVLLCARDLEALPLARFVSQGLAEVWEVQELRFSPSETRQFLLQSVGTEERSEVLQARLEGWPAGIALAAAHGAGSLKPEDLILEVLRGLPETLRAALPRAVVLDPWSHAGATSVGCALPARWLETARAAGLPLTPLGGGNFRPHGLLLSVLEDELRHDPPWHERLHRSAAELAWRDGDGLRALRHARAGRDLTRAVQIAEGVALEYARREAYELSHDLLASLPETQFTPRLLEVWGRSLLETGRVAEAERVLRQLRADYPTRFWGVSGLAFLLQRGGQYEALAELLTVTQTQAQLEEPEQTELQLLQAINARVHGDLAGSLQLAETVSAWAERHHEPVLLARALSHAGTIFGLMGAEDRAYAAAERAYTVLEANGLHNRALTPLSKLIDFNLRRLRVETASGQLRRGFELARTNPGLPAMIFLHHRAEIAFWQGNLASAAPDYGQAALEAERLEARLPWVYSGLRLLECRVLEALERTAPRDAPTLEDLRMVVGRVPDSECEAFTQQALFLEGLIRLVRGDLSAARIALGGVVDPDEPEYCLRAEVYLAWLALGETNLTRPPVQALQRDLDDLELTVLKPDLRVVESLYRELLARGWAEERLSGWLRTALAFAAEFKLRVQTLGEPQASLNAKPLRVALSKSLELLVLLVLRGPQSREALVDALWDGTNDPRHLEYFKVAVRQLRANLRTASLDFNPLPFENGLYRLHPRLSLHTDLDDLEEALKCDDPGALTHAFETSRAEFMPLCQSEWAVWERLHAQERGVALGLQLAARLEGGDTPEAIRVLREVLRRDSLCDAAQQGLARLTGVASQARGRL